MTAELLPDEIKIVMEEAYASHEPRNLLGVNVEVDGRGDERRITSITLPNGRLLGRSQKYLVAFNTFDSRSAGHRFMKLRAPSRHPGRQLHTASNTNARHFD